MTVQRYPPPPPIYPSFANEIRCEFDRIDPISGGDLCRFSFCPKFNRIFLTIVVISKNFLAISPSSNELQRNFNTFLETGLIYISHPLRIY